MRSEWHSFHMGGDHVPRRATGHHRPSSGDAYVGQTTARQCSVGQQPVDDSPPRSGGRAAQLAEQRACCRVDDGMPNVLSASSRLTTLSGHARLVLNGVADHYLGNVVVFVRLGGGSSEVTSVHPASSPSTGSAAVVERSTVVPLGDGLVHPFSTSRPRSRYFVCRLPEVDTTSYLAHGPTPVIRSTVMWVM